MRIEVLDELHEVEQRFPAAFPIEHLPVSIVTEGQLTPGDPQAVIAGPQGNIWCLTIASDFTL